MSYAVAMQIFGLNDLRYEKKEIWKWNQLLSKFDFPLIPNDVNEKTKDTHKISE